MIDQKTAEYLIDAIQKLTSATDRLTEAYTATTEPVTMSEAERKRFSEKYENIAPLVEGSSQWSTADLQAMASKVTAHSYNLPRSVTAHAEKQTNYGTMSFEGVKIGPVTEAEVLAFDRQWSGVDSTLTPYGIQKMAECLTSFARSRGLIA